MFIENQSRNKVERAISEVRRGLPILIYDDENNYLLLAAAETLEKKLFSQYKLISGNVYVTLTASKVKYICQSKEHSSKRLLISNFDELLHLINCSKEDSIKELQCSKTIDAYAVALLKFSELLPYALVADMTFENKHEMRNWCEENDIIALNTLLVNDFQRNHSVYEVCKTSLFLKQTQEVDIISYRTKSGGREHYAIIIGKPDKDNEPLVRIHSSCYTGDLLDSLSCDCRSQLHHLDTVDANRVLGFEDDERSFAVAAKMLKKLNINKIQLLTNNGRKLSELKNNGIEVTKCIPLIMERNEYNDSYMETKFGKLGHGLRVC
ncbi:MAG: GTP cyclohydrolase II [Wolbachia sp.]